MLVYDGIGTEAGALLIGRVIADRGLGEPKVGESTATKITRLRRLLSSHPLENTAVELRAAGRHVRVRTDSRGFFRWRVPGPLPVGEHRVQAHLAAGHRHRVLPGRLFIYPKRPGTLWISDIDDTVLETDVRHKVQMIRGLLTTSAIELNSFPGVAPVLWQSRKAGDALAFVSGSPWQLQPRLRTFMAHRGLPRAPFFLKRIGIGDDTDALFGQGDYKRRQLELLLTLLPGYRVVCFGDSGEHDPEVYRALQLRHPKRVVAVLIHDVGGLQAQDPRVAGQFLFRQWPAAERWLRGRGLLTALTVPTAAPLPGTTTPAAR